MPTPGALSDNTPMQSETTSEFAEMQPAPGLGALLGGVLLRPRALFAQAFDEMTEPGKAWLVVGALILLAGMGAAALNSSAVARLMSSFAPVMAPGAEGGPAGPGGAVVVTSGVPQSTVVKGDGAMSSQVAGASPLAAIMGSLTSAAGALAGWCVWSVGLLIGGMLFGGRSTFSQTFKMTVLAHLPMLIGSLVAIGALAAGARPLFNPGFAGFLPAGPGALNALLRGALGALSLWQVWTLVLMAVGVSVLARLKMRKAAPLVLVLGLLIVVIGALPTLAFSSFTQ